MTSTKNSVSAKYERAPMPERRIAAIEKLAGLGFDVSIRVSPFISDWIDKPRINRIKCDKLLIEFLRVNSWIRKWMPDIDFSEYTLRQHGYHHLPLRTKIKELEGFDKPFMSVCEDVDDHYWRQNFNANFEDCCNLTIKGEL